MPAYNLVPPNTANFPGGNEFAFRKLSYPQRTLRAQNLMRQAGFGPDKRVKATYMNCATTAGTYRAVAAALSRCFRKSILMFPFCPTTWQFSTTVCSNTISILPSQVGAPISMTHPIFSICCAPTMQTIGAGTEILPMTQY